jgi:hypothetical protein
MTDPRILSIVSIIFALMGSYSLYTGSRRIRDARRAGIRLRWYKQIAFLTGIEYILLTFVFLLTIANRSNQISSSERTETSVLFFFLLIAAAVVAGMVIRQGLLDMRAARARRSQVIAADRPSTPALEAAAKAPTREDPADQARHQRERRKNAAAARRRRAGKA